MGRTRICWDWNDGTMRSFVIRIWSFVIHSGFGFRHFFGICHSDFSRVQPISKPECRSNAETRCRLKVRRERKKRADRKGATTFGPLKKTLFVCVKIAYLF
jgi:hypothetical protein